MLDFSSGNWVDTDDEDTYGDLSASFLDASWKPNYFAALVFNNQTSTLWHTVYSNTSTVYFVGVPAALKTTDGEDQVHAQKLGGYFSIDGAGKNDFIFLDHCDLTSVFIDGGSGEKDQLYLAGKYNLAVSKPHIQGIEILRTTGAKVLWNQIDEKFQTLLGTYVLVPTKHKVLLNLRAECKDTGAFITGSTDDEQIIGSALAGNVLKGGGGDDELWGGKDHDLLIGGAADDILEGYGGEDSLDGGAGDDELHGGEGIDFMQGGLGDDTYFVDSIFDSIYKELSKGGIDTVKTTLQATGLVQYKNTEDLFLLSGAADGYGNESANLIIGNKDGNKLYGFGGDDNIDGRGGSDKLYGGEGKDELLGDDGIDTLSGEGGNDIILGELGSDRLIGGLGRDTMTGGDGEDFFQYASIRETGLGSARDLIKDFKPNQDRIDLRAINAVTGSSTDQKFKFIGDKDFTGVKGQLHYRFETAFTVVEGDINGDKKADFEIGLTGHKLLSSGDFLL